MNRFQFLLSFLGEKTSEFELFHVRPPSFRLYFLIFSGPGIKRGYNSYIKLLSCTGSAATF